MACKDETVYITGFHYRPNSPTAVMKPVSAQANRTGCSLRTDIIFRIPGHTRPIAVHTAQVKVRERDIETIWYIYFVNGKYSVNQAIKTVDGVAKKWAGYVLVMKGGPDIGAPFVSVQEGDQQRADQVVKKCVWDSLSLLKYK
jgi:hypothetical protein